MSKERKDKRREKNTITRETKSSYKEPKLRIKSSLISFMVCLLLLGIFVLIGYFLFGGIIEGAVLGVLFLIVWFIGRLFDKPKAKSKKRKTIKIIVIIFLIFFILALLGGCAFLYYVVKNAPDFKQELLKEKESTILYDSQGKEYAKLGLELRENIEYDQLSEAFIDALIATEDSRFFQHNGFDLMRFARAAVGQALGQGDSGGGSTLTMQLSKNTFTSKNASGIEGIIRKFTDIYISIFQIEKSYTKQQIIEFYANNHNLSGTIFGVQEAARHFFNKEAKDLTITEAAVIVGMYQAPTSYNPFNKPQAAEKRRNTVLYLMERHGYITSEERKIAASIPIESLLTDTSKPTNEYQGYIDLVCSEVQSKYGVDPYTTPMLVYTNMIRSSQDGINNIVNGKTYKWKDEDMQTGIAAVDTTSGKIIAIGAGRNRSGAKSFNYATFDEKSQRQIGSTAKPLFDYGPGIEYNQWSTYTLFDDKPYTYSNGKPIHNVDNAYKGIITLRSALVGSRNIPALKAFQQTDNKKIVDFVTTVGITPEISNGSIHEAHAIGAFTGSNPLAMAGAYQVFSNGGYYYEPYSVNKIIFRDDNKTIEYSSPKVKVLSDSTAYMISDVLKGVLNTTNSHARKVRTDLPKDHIAAKTGTTNVDSAVIRSRKLPSSIVRDFWIMGYTHNVSVSIWIGYDKLDSKHYLNFYSDGNRRFTLLGLVGKAVFKHDGKDFTKPSSVISVTVERGSNPPKLPSSSTPSDQLVTELFKKGTEPTEVSTKYLSVGTPGNLSVADYGSYATLSWSGVKDPGYVENGVFGYYVYFNGEKLYFTQNTSYTFSNMSSYYGTYGVRAGYKDTTDSISDIVQYVYKEKVYKVTCDPASKTVYVDDSISSSLYDGSNVKVYTDNVDITTYAKIASIKITDKNGNQVAYPSSSSPNTYKVTYNVTHGTYSGSCSNTITVIEKPQPTENPEPIETDTP